MTDTIEELRRDLAIANRLVANEGILDAFGHISMRNPTNPNRYFLSRSLAPAQIQADDIQEYDLDSQPIISSPLRPYMERVIHGEIYKARPDVNAVCHHHAPGIMPFAISGVPVLPVFHLGASMGRIAPFWDSRDEFGDTNLLVAKPEEGASLARALGSHTMVVMRRHGATVVGRNLKELIFATIYSTRNAEYQLAAHSLGHVSPLSAGEIDMAEEIHRAPGPLARAYDVWAQRLSEREGRASAASTVATTSARRTAAATKTKPTAAKKAKSAKKTSNKAKPAKKKSRGK